MTSEEEPTLGVELCPDCSWPVDSFACKIRHLSINSGSAKASQSPKDGSRWKRAADLHHKKFG